jgi:hypothetical protein
MIRSKTIPEPLVADQLVNQMKETSIPSSKTPLIGKPTLILCAILILGTTIAVLLIKSQQKTLDNIFKPSSESAPTLTTDKSSNEALTNGTEDDWRTYSNVNLGISFNYPSNYRFLSESDHSVDIFSPLDPQKPSLDISSNDLRVTIDKELAWKNQTLDQFIKNRLGQDSRINHRAEAMIGGFNAVEVQSQSLNTGDEGIDFFLSKDGYFYIISKTPLETSRQNEFDQILSTFKFIETPQEIIYEDGSKLPQDVVNVMRKYYPDKDTHPKFNNFAKYGDGYIEVSVQSKYGGFAVGLIKRPKGWVKIWAGQDRPACSTLELHLAPERIECARLETEGFNKTHEPINASDVEIFIKKGFGLRDKDVITIKSLEGDNTLGDITTAEGYGSYWAAGKIAGKWSYGFGGNGIPSCTEVEEFPVGVFRGKFDSCSLDDGQLFDRKTNTPVK